MKQFGIVKVVETKTTIYQVETEQAASGEDLKIAAQTYHTGGNPINYVVSTVTEMATAVKYHLDYQLQNDRPKEKEIKPSVRYR